MASTSCEIKSNTKLVTESRDGGLDKEPGKNGDNLKTQKK